MITKAKAPLRIGLAGGGTDVSPYADIYGGIVVNATIDLYAHAEIMDIHSEMILFKHGDDQIIQLPIQQIPDPNSLPPPFDLHAGVYTWFANKFGNSALQISTMVDVPLGSGLGTSSTLVVAILGSLFHHFQIEKTPSEIAAHAIDIERNLLQHEGGKQDQYAASLGGINAMYFQENVEVVPIHSEFSFLKILSDHLILYYTSHNRLSSSIIREQMNRTRSAESIAINAMHALKNQAKEMLQAFQQNNHVQIATLLGAGFKEKKKMATGISTDLIERIYKNAMDTGAVSGKISGAGGGGFMIFYCQPQNRAKVIKALCNFGGQVYPFSFVQEGLKTWTED